MAVADEVAVMGDEVGEVVLAVVSDEVGEVVAAVVSDEVGKVVVADVVEAEEGSKWWMIGFGNARLHSMTQGVAGRIPREASTVMM